MSLNSRPGFLVFCFCLATAIGLVMGIGSNRVGQGLAGFAIVFFPWVVITALRSDALELLDSGPQDERQTRLQLEAMAITGLVLCVGALAGGMVELARGGIGRLGVLAAVGGATYLAASVLLPRRR